MLYLGLARPCTGMRALTQDRNSSSCLLPVVLYYYYLPTHYPRRHSLLFNCVLLSAT